MDILQYFDNSFGAVVSLKQLYAEQHLILIIYIEDLIRFANERLSDEINWIIDCLWTDAGSFDYSSISKSVRKSMQKSYFDTSNKKTIIEYVLSLTRGDVYNQFIIDKAIEILGVIIQEHLFYKIAEINVVFSGTTDLDDILARKRENTTNTIICEQYQQLYIKDLKKKNKYIKQEWNTAHLTPGSVFMQQVKRAFQRSKLSFIKCLYRIYDMTEFGHADQKTKQIIQQYHKENQKCNILIFARSRGTILQLLNYCNQTNIPLYFQQIDIKNLPDYDIQPVNLLEITKQMFYFCDLYMTRKLNSREVTRGLIILILLFRNPIFQLPITTQYYSIPCIVVIYKEFLQQSKYPLVDDDFNLNPKQFALILRIIHQLHIFFKSNEQIIKKYPNLLYLYICNALKSKGKQVQVAKTQLVKKSHIFPQISITSKSVEREFVQVMKYSDFYYQEPDIVFLNGNYQSPHQTIICKLLTKNIMIDRRILKKINQRDNKHTQSEDMCFSYLTQIQKAIYAFKSQSRFIFNTFNYQYTLFPDIQKLISYCEYMQNKPKIFANILAEHDKQIYIPLQLVSVLSVPCDYQYIENSSKVDLPMTSIDIFPYEVQLNMQRFQRLFPNLVTPIAYLKQQFEIGININNVNIGNHFVFNMRFQQFIVNSTQQAALLNDLVPYVSKIYISQKKLQ